VVIRLYELLRKLAIRLRGLESVQVTPVPGVYEPSALQLESGEPRLSHAKSIGIDYTPNRRDLPAMDIVRLTRPNRRQRGPLSLYHEVLRSSLVAAHVIIQR
jgi:hypothetical protein